jgi:hypothetical protein
MCQDLWDALFLLLSIERDTKAYQELGEESVCFLSVCLCRYVCTHACDHCGISVSLCIGPLRIASFLISTSFKIFL